MARLAFYVAKHGNLVDKAIALWTGSKYSHVELVINSDWYSTSPREGKVRRKKLIPKEWHWDFVEVQANISHVVDLYDKTRGSKYDWKGIWLTQFFPFDRHSKNKYFCSEWCAKALQLDKPYKYSPGRLYKKVNDV